MSFSAADLQKKHALEGAPDPFPSLSSSSATPKAANGKAAKKNPEPLDTSSETAFPSLAPASGKRQATPSAWSAPRPAVIRPAVQSSTVSDTFELPQIELKAAGKDGKATTLAEVMRLVQSKSGTTVEASTQRLTGKTTFIVKGSSENAIDQAKRQLISHLSPVVTKKVEAPTSTIGTIIGSKGATLKQIRDQTGVKIDIPKPGNASLTVPANGDAISRSPSPGVASGEEEEEATVPISVTGPTQLVDEAIAMIQDIINAKTSKTTQRVKDIPAHLFQFLAREKDKIADRLGQEQPYATLNITLNEKQGQIVCQGDRVVVAPAVQALKTALGELDEIIKNVTISIPRNQHRFVLSQEVAEEFIDKYEVVIKPQEGGEGITIWGSTKIGDAITAILMKSSSQNVQSYQIPGEGSLPKAVYTYLDRTSYLQKFVAAHPSISIDWSPSAEIEKTGKVFIDFVGDKAQVKAAIKELDDFVKKLEHSLRELELDWIVHKVLQNKHAATVKKAQDTHNVAIFFPDESAEQSTVLLVFDPRSARGNAAPAEKKKHLNAVADEIKKVAPDANDIRSEVMTVERKWHQAILGKNDEIIGEAMLSIKVAGPAESVSLRGPSADVDRAILEIEAIIEAAKQDEAESSYFIEFEIPKDYVGRIVGSQGSAVRQLREAHNVRIDFNDEAVDDSSEWTEKGRGKKSAPKSRVKITGKKDNAHEAKKKILAQVEKMADEAEERITVPKQYHSALIGPSGKYVTRMEDTHVVKIFFPRDGSGRDNLKPDEVLIKGGRKGVAAAKAELLEIVEFEKQSNASLSFTVPTRAVARILGKGGAQIAEIKQNTGAQIDVEKEESSPGQSSITVRGSQEETKAAKAAILAIANEVGDEATEVLHIDSKYHRNFIGKGGETLKQLIINAGGPDDPRLQAGLVHFPRSGEPADEVRLRGEKKLVSKLKKELEKLAATYRDRVVLGVAIPAAQHRALIGRGGQHLNELQTKTNTQIWFPGSRAYASAGDLDNADQLGDAPAEDLVKVCGARAACQTAISELQSKAEASATPRPSRIATPQEGNVTRTVSVPLKYHHAVVGHGSLVRALRPLGVFVDFSQVPAEQARTRPANGAASSARIDQDDDAPPADGIEWEVVSIHQGAEEGDAEWTFRGKDEASLDSAEKVLNEALEHAKSYSHVGYLTVANRSAFPRIVGAKGSNVSRIRTETDTEITVGKGDNTIVIVGSEAGIEAAKKSILQTIEGGGRGRRHD